MKRQGLIPFPRVGRSGDGNAEKKGDIAENGGAMWFGPRLGRLQKRNYFDDDDWALVSLRGSIGSRNRSLNVLNVSKKGEAASDRSTVYGLGVKISV